MPAFLNRISEQITAFWNKMNIKQRVQLVSITLVILLALFVLAFVLSRPRMVVYDTDLDPATVNSVKAVLDAEGIKYTISEDAKTVYVQASQRRDATLALENEGILSRQGMTYKELFENSITMTQYEKMLKYQIYFQGELARKIEKIDAIDSAEVTLVMPEEDRTILDDKLAAKATAVLTTNRDLTSQQVQGIVSFLATSVKNLSKENVSIIDSTGRLLFDGVTVTNVNGNLIANSDYEVQQELLMQQKIRSILLSRGEYDDAFVSVDLKIDFDELTTISERYIPQEGTNKGVVSSESVRTAESTNTNTGNPVGTDANEEVVDTFIESSGESSSTVEESNIDYKVDVEKSTLYRPSGIIKYDESSVSVVLNKFKVYNQALLEAGDGLGDLTWEEFKAENSQRVKLDVDEDIISLIASASNSIPNYTVIAYEVPRFIDKEVRKTPINDYILIGIIVLMVLILAYAIYKGTEPEEIVEVEPELSVEQMLESTMENQEELEAIEFENKSEARQQVEKFVDDNPEAAALLLKTWLNEQWG